MRGEERREKERGGINKEYSVVCNGIIRELLATSFIHDIINNISIMGKLRGCDNKTK